MTDTLYHNPACGTSRKVLAVIRESGNAQRALGYARGAKPAR